MSDEHSTELPEWMEALRTADDDGTCQSFFMKRMLLLAMERRLHAANTQAAAEALVQHLDNRQREVERAEREMS